LSSSSTWTLYSNTLFRSEVMEEIYDLDPSTSYDFRWKALTKSSTVLDSLYSSIITGTTATYPNIVYIDPTWAGTHSGTLSLPLADFPSSPTAGYSYLLKRGTTLARTTKWEFYEMGFKIGAYGTGVNPIVSYTGTDYCIKCAISTPGNLDIENVTFKANSISGSNSLLNIGTNTSGTVNIINCTFHNALRGIISSGCTGMTLRILGCLIYDTDSDGIITGAKLALLEVGYTYIHNVNCSHSHGGSDDGDCIQEDDAVSVWIHHCVLDHYTHPNKFCLIITYDTSVETTYLVTAIVEYNLFRRKNTTEGICVYLTGTSGANTKVRYNTFQDAAMGIENRSYGNYIYGNTFVHLATAYESAYTGTTLFYNNTFYNIGSIITNNNDEEMTFKNNIFHTITGAAFDQTDHRTSDYNTYWNITNRVITLGTHDITTNPLFVSPTTYNFSLQSTSPSKGTGVYIAGYTPTTAVDRGSGLSLDSEADSSKGV
jgi:hypothetical protein